MKKYNIYFLHGFLGQASDGDDLIEALKSHIEINKVIAPNLFSKEDDGEFQIEESEFPNILIGYSMGGRLALHLFLENKTVWDKLILLSVNPGVCADIPARKLWEKQWAEKFQQDNWEELIEGWNGQSVFEGCPPKPRQEADYDRSKLASAFENYSLTEHDFELSELKGLDQDIYWVHGDQDHKYKALMEELKSQEISGRYLEVPASGHRLLGASQQLSQVLAKHLK